MEIVIMISQDHAALDRLIAAFESRESKSLLPIWGDNHQLIGSVLRIWRDGDLLKGDAEVVPELVATHEQT